MSTAPAFGGRGRSVWFISALRPAASLPAPPPARSPARQQPTAFGTMRRMASSVRFLSASAAWRMSARDSVASVGSLYCSKRSSSVVRVSGGQMPPVHRRPGDNGHADSHALTVGNGKVPAGFNSVAHRMAEVQKSTLAPVKFIALHHVPLGGHATRRVRALTGPGQAFGAVPGKSRHRTAWRS